MHSTFVVWPILLIGIALAVAVVIGLRFLFSRKDKNMPVEEQQPAAERPAGRATSYVLTALLFLPVLAVVNIVIAVVAPHLLDDVHVDHSQHVLVHNDVQHDTNVASYFNTTTTTTNDRADRGERDGDSHDSSSSGKRKKKHENLKITLGGDGDVRFETSRERIELTVGDVKIGYPFRKQKAADEKKASIVATADQEDDEIIALGDEGAIPMVGSTQETEEDEDSAAAESSEADSDGPVETANDTSPGEGGAPPEWLKESGDSSTGQVVIEGKPQLTEDQAVVSALKATALVIKERFHEAYGDRGQWEVPLDTILAAATEAKYVEPYEITTPSFPEGIDEAPMYRAHLLIDTSPDALAHFYQPWRAQVVNRRLWAFGGLVALLTLLVGTAAGYLQLDARSNGAYRGRLKLAAVTLIVVGGFVLVGVLPLN